jgi:hypothetical protein
VSVRGGGWLVEPAGRLRPSEGAGKAAQRVGRRERAEKGWWPRGRGGEGGPASRKLESGQLKKKKNPFQISFKFWIWQNFGKLYREILKEFGHSDFS